MSSLGFDRVILEAIGGLPSPDADFVRRTYEMILSEPESGFWKERLSCAIKGDPCSVQAMSAHLIRTRTMNPHNDLLHFWLAQERRVCANVSERDEQFSSPPPSPWSIA